MRALYRIPHHSSLIPHSYMLFIHFRFRAIIFCCTTSLACPYDSR